MIFYLSMIKYYQMTSSLWDTINEDLQDKIINFRDELLEYDTKLLKVHNSFLREYIQNYMRTKGRRLTNLNIATKDKLLNLFKIYNIPKIPYHIVVKDKEQKIKEQINSTNKFQVGRYKTKYENNFDGHTTTYDITIDILKVTKCYITFHFRTQYNDYREEKLWINKCTDTEYVKFSIYYIYSYKLTPI